MLWYLMRKGHNMQTSQIVLGVIVLLIIWAFIEQKQLVTTKYNVETNRLPKAFHNTKFVVLADLHNYYFGKKNIRLFQRIERLAPEFIIVAGDMINKRSTCYPSHAFDILEQLSKKYKIYYAYGNHEQRIERSIAEHKGQELDEVCSSWLEFKQILSHKGVIFLDNQSCTIQKNRDILRITGLSIDKRFFERSKFPKMEEDYLTSLINRCQKDTYNILIAHNPVYFTDYAKWGADLTLSGHLHGGMVRLPGIGGVISPQVKLFPKYNAGNFTEAGQELVVSRGLGSHSYMPRLFNAPEIVQITLKYKA